MNVDDQIANKTKQTEGMWEQFYLKLRDEQRQYEMLLPLLEVIDRRMAFAGSMKAACEAELRRLDEKIWQYSEESNDVESLILDIKVNDESASFALIIGLEHDLKVLDKKVEDCLVEKFKLIKRIGRLARKVNILEDLAHEMGSDLICFHGCSSY